MFYSYVTTGRVSEEQKFKNWNLNIRKKTRRTNIYIDINEAGKIGHNRIRDQLKKEYFGRIKSIANTQLNARNQVKAINTYAVPVLLYSFVIWAVL